MGADLRGDGTGGLTGRIIGAGIEVHRALGPGLLEKTYEVCLDAELRHLGISVQRQVPLPVVYRDVRLDCGYRIDMLVEGPVMVELHSSRLTYIGIQHNMRVEKPLVWVGGARRDLREFPEDARAEAGRALRRVQSGGDPPSWKPIPVVGPGTREIRLSTVSGGRVEHRVFYVASFPDAVYVLHAFRKTAAATSRHDIELGRRRYREMLAHRKERQARDDR